MRAQQGGESIGADRQRAKARVLVGKLRGPQWIVNTRQAATCCNRLKRRAADTRTLKCAIQRRDDGVPGLAGAMHQRGWSATAVGDVAAIRAFHADLGFSAAAIDADQIFVRCFQFNSHAFFEAHSVSGTALLLFR